MLSESYVKYYYVASVCSDGIMIFIKQPGL